MNNAIRLSVAQNGFVLTYDDPTIAKENMESKGAYKDPERVKVYTEFDTLLADVPGIMTAMKDHMESDSGKEEDFSSALSSVMDKDDD